MTFVLSAMAMALSFRMVKGAEFRAEMFRLPSKPGVGIRALSLRFRMVWGLG